MKVQTEINKIIDVLIVHGVTNVINALKYSMQISGFDAGKAAYPAKVFSADDISALKAAMEDAGYKY